MKSTPSPGSANPEILPLGENVHIIGAGPVGLFLTALLQSTERFNVRLYEKRPTYTRTRMVRLSSFLAADSIESYCIDHVDGETVEAVFDVNELDETLAFRRSIPPVQVLFPIVSPRSDGGIEAFGARKNLKGLPQVTR